MPLENHRRVAQEATNKVQEIFVRNQWFGWRDGEIRRASDCKGAKTGRFLGGKNDKIETLL